MSATCRTVDLAGDAEYRVNSLVDGPEERIGVLMYGASIDGEQSRPGSSLTAGVLGVAGMSRVFMTSAEGSQRSRSRPVLPSASTVLRSYFSHRPSPFLMSLKNILVPYDFSDCATDALRVAATWRGGPVPPSRWCISSN